MKNHTLNFMLWMLHIQSIRYTNSEAMSRVIENLNSYDLSNRKCSTTA